MSSKDFLTEQPTAAIEDTPEYSAFACEHCNKMYQYEDAVAVGMVCCNEPLKELDYEASLP